MNTLQANITAIGKYVPKPKKEVDLKPEVDITEAADIDIIEQNNKICMDEKMNANQYSGH